MYKRTVPHGWIGGNCVITVFKNKQDIPKEMDYIELNDLFFNQNTVLIIDEHARRIMEQIDGVKWISKYKISSRFNGVALDIDKLSTGCKTVLNVMYYPEKVFCMKECGDNALGILYALKEGNVCSEYAMIPFDMESVIVQTAKEKKVISDYEELKAWWQDEK